MNIGTTVTHLLLQHELTTCSGNILPLFLPYSARQSILLQDDLKCGSGTSWRRPEVKIWAQDRVPWNEVDDDIAAAKQLPQLMRVDVEAVEVGTQQDVPTPRITYNLNS
jgi:hypothetical protein